MFQLGYEARDKKLRHTASPQKALFLDRDGVINVDYGYVHQVENFEFCEGIFDLVSFANAADYRVLVVTNQAGIARGYYSERDFKYLTYWMLDEFRSRKCWIDQVYYSPFHPTEGHGAYRRDHPTRKPRPGMFLKAISDWNLSTKDSLMIGDQESDLSAAAKAGIVNTLLYDQQEAKIRNTQAHAVIDDLRNACSYL